MNWVGLCDDLAVAIFGEIFISFVVALLVQGCFLGDYMHIVFDVCVKRKLCNSLVRKPAERLLPGQGPFL